MAPRTRIDAVLSYLLTAAAITVAAAVVRREFFAAAARPVQPDDTVRYVEKWKDAFGAGVTFGSNSAPVQIGEFADLECPFCRAFHSTLQRVRQAYRGSATFTFVHYPIASHRFARPAARALECADSQGRFEAFLDVAFAKQDSLGLKSWMSFAREARVPDLPGFIRCAIDTVRVARIEAGLTVGRQLGVRGTPTVLVNGWQLPGTPSDSELVSVVDALLAGRNPFPSMPHR